MAFSMKTGQYLGNARPNQIAAIREYNTLKGNANQELVSSKGTVIRKPVGRRHYIFVGRSQKPVLLVPENMTKRIPGPSMQNIYKQYLRIGPVYGSQQGELPVLQIGPLRSRVLGTLFADSR